MLRFAALVFALFFLSGVASAADQSQSVFEQPGWEYRTIYSTETKKLNDMSSNGWLLQRAVPASKGRSMLMFGRPKSSARRGAKAETRVVRDSKKVREEKEKAEDVTGLQVVEDEGHDLLADSDSGTNQNSFDNENSASGGPIDRREVNNAPVKWQYQAFPVNGRHNLNALFATGWEPVLASEGEGDEKLIVMRKELKPGETPEIVTTTSSESTQPVKKSGPLPTTVARRILDELGFNPVVAKGGIEYGVTQDTFRKLSAVGKIVVDKEGTITISDDEPIPLNEPLVPQRDKATIESLPKSIPDEEPELDPRDQNADRSEEKAEFDPFDAPEF